MMKGGMAGLMKQAQQMQEKMQKMQEELANAEVTGQSGAGLVSVVMTGRHDVKRITLDDSLMQEDKEVLEDLIAAAVNDAVRKVEQNSQEKMAGMTAGMQLPPASKCLSEAVTPSRHALLRCERPRASSFTDVNSGARGLSRLVLHTVWSPPRIA